MLKIYLFVAEGVFSCMKRIPSNESSEVQTATNREDGLDAKKFDFDGDFDKASLSDLSQATGVDGAQWCRWFKGVGTSETSLRRAAVALSVSPGTLLDRIINRRNQ